MFDNLLDILTLDEFEKLEAGGVEKVVAGHRIEEDLENGFEQLVLDNLAVVEIVMQTDACPEVFQSSYVKLAMMSRRVKGLPY